MSDHKSRISNFFSLNKKGRSDDKRKEILYDESYFNF